MSLLHTKRLRINPTEIQHAPLIKDFFDSGVEYIEAYIPHSYKNPITGDIEELTFTHDLRFVNKPENIEKNKESRDYLAVCTPRTLGSGSFGQVYPVNGMWKNTLTAPQYKVKEDINKLRALKIGLLSEDKLEAHWQTVAYNHEQEIGQWAPHMGLKYPPTQGRSSNTLLMRKLPGESLQTILDKLKTDRNYLSVTQRFQITINLLRKLDLQVNGIKLPDKYGAPDAYLVHQDLKPGNVLVTKDGDINIIDYGLAIPSCMDVRGFELSGTDNYIDPHRYNTNGRLNPNKETDLASVARIIAVLWGDHSRFREMTINEFRHMLKTNYTEGLGNQITSLRPGERSQLITLIKTMTSYREKDRLTREVALEKFEKLRKNRELYLKRRLEGRIKLLSPVLLIEILKSPLATNLIKRFKNEPQLFPGFLQKIKSKLYQLDEKTIISLAQNGLDFKKHVLTYEDIAANYYTSEQIQLMCQFGATLEPNLLKKWICEHTADNTLVWAKMGRALYRATPTPSKAIDETQLINSFEGQYYLNYITNEETAADEETNVRLFARHYDACKKDKIKYKQIKKNLEYLLNEPLGKAILESPLMRPSQELLLYPRNYKNLNDAILAFLDIEKYINSLKPNLGMKKRQIFIENIREQLNNRRKLNGFNDWEVALADLDHLKAQIKVILKLDLCRERLIEIKVPVVVARLKKEFDAAYQTLTSESMRTFETNFNFVLKALTEVYAEINRNRDIIHFYNPTLLTSIDKEFSSTLEDVTIKKGNVFFHSCIYYGRRYQELADECKASMILNPKVPSAVAKETQRFFHHPESVGVEDKTREEKSYVRN